MIIRFEGCYYQLPTEMLYRWGGTKSDLRVLQKELRVILEKQLELVNSHRITVGEFTRNLLTDSHLNETKRKFIHNTFLDLKDFLGEEDFNSLYRLPEDVDVDQIVVEDRDQNGIDIETGDIICHPSSVLTEEDFIDEYVPQGGMLELDVGLLGMSSED